MERRTPSFPGMCCLHRGPGPAKSIWRTQSLCLEIPQTLPPILLQSDHRVSRMKTPLSPSFLSVTDAWPQKPGCEGQLNPIQQTASYFLILMWRPREAATGECGGRIWVIISPAKDPLSQRRDSDMRCEIPGKMSPIRQTGSQTSQGASTASYLTLVCRFTYRLWKLFVFSIWPALGPCNLWMISAFISMAMWAGSRESRSRSWTRWGRRNKCLSDNAGDDQMTLEILTDLQEGQFGNSFLEAKIQILEIYIGNKKRFSKVRVYYYIIYWILSVCSSAWRIKESKVVSPEIFKSILILK